MKNEMWPCSREVAEGSLERDYGIVLPLRTITDVKFMNDVLEKDAGALNDVVNDSFVLCSVVSNFTHSCPLQVDYMRFNMRKMPKREDYIPFVFRTIFATELMPHLVWKCNAGQVGRRRNELPGAVGICMAIDETLKSERSVEQQQSKDLKDTYWWT